jgi:Na+-translocating ferredoxin:NAD+ oxidoreductase RnfD subunit
VSRREPPAPSDAVRVSRERLSFRDRSRRAYARAIGRLPKPVRLLWVVLAILGADAVLFHLGGLGALPLLVLPAVAAETDFLFQVFRFRSVRFPDPGIATGALLAVLLPPTVSLLQAGAVSVAAVALRHAVRQGERPVFNPAATGVLIGALFFGMAPSWWGAIDVRFVVVLGLVLTLRSPGSWRAPLGFFAAYAPIRILVTLSFGESTNPGVLLLGALDPSILFFGFFMVPEPRSSLILPLDRWFFGALVGMGTALLGALLPSLAPLVALLLANVVALVVRRIEARESLKTEIPRRGSSRTRQRRKRKARLPSPISGQRPEWDVGQRVAAGFAILVLLGAIAFVSFTPTATPFAAIRPSPSSPTVAGNLSASCANDNPTIPSDLLTFLHQRLGPSVIRSADANTGVVVFFDPVNQVTVTETDVYEDYGYAEFNGDDYAVSGCSA